ncbi:MAG: fibronectin type III domain-containing protein [Candidatus Aminicenantales bacterium]
MRNRFAILVSCGILLSANCGKKGNLLPPLVRIPEPPEAVEAVQRADKIILSWKNPEAFVDGRALERIDRVEVWVFEKDIPAEEGPGQEAEETPRGDAFERKGELAGTIEAANFEDHRVRDERAEPRLRFVYTLPEAAAASRTFLFALRVNVGKKYSDFSEPVSITPLIVPLPPEDVSATAFEDRIEIRWKAPSENMDHSGPARVKGYNVYRSVDEGEPERLNEELIKGETFSDRDFLFGQTYTYFVRASATESPPYYESGDSEPAEVEARDVFAPGAPEGLAVVAGQDLIALTWDPNPEKDIAGYRVWRKAEGEEGYQVMTAAPIRDNAFMDTQVESGIRYAYAVTAVDQAGNESPKSRPVSGSLRKEIG